VVTPQTFGGQQLWADRRWSGGWRVQENALTGRCRLVDAEDLRHASGSFEVCAHALECAEKQGDVRDPRSPHLVILLHGLGRTRRSLAGMAGAVAGVGFETATLAYPSTRRSIEDHARCVLEVVSYAKAERVSFVTHSLGGLVARTALAHPEWPADRERHRLVMLAPPSNGAQLARRLDSVLFRAVMGPAATQLARGHDVPPPAVPFAIVAGSQRQGEGRNPLLEGDDDGVVALRETKLEGASRFVVVDSIHTFIMDHFEAQREAVAFLTSDEV